MIIIINNWYFVKGIIYEKKYYSAKNRVKYEFIIFLCTL